MYLGFYSFYRRYNGNRMFTDPSSPIGDDLMYPFVFLAQQLSKMGHRVATLDTDYLEKFDAVVFMDHPTWANPFYRQLRRMPDKKMYLFLMENAANRPDNYWSCNHRGFDKVFTWNGDLVDGKKYFKFYLPNKIPANFQIDLANRNKFCVTIASQKYSSHPQELYSERVRAIRWFEQYHPDDFDLFGTLWEQPYFTGKLARLNLGLQQFYIRYPEVLRKNRFPSHRGTVKSKNAVMRQYKFALAYENAVFPGYITEKLFDALFAGCVPVYLGAPDVAAHVPPEVFIDRRKFRDHAELYHYMKSMPESVYQAYLRAIESFVRGKQSRSFAPEQFTETVFNHILKPSAAT